MKPSRNLTAPRWRARLAFLISPIFLAAIALGGVTLVVAVVLWNSRVAAHRDALVYVDNHARIAEEHARLAISEVIDSLQVAAGFLETADLAGQDGRLDSFVDRIRASSPRIERVAIIAGDGRIIAGDRTGINTAMPGSPPAIEPGKLFALRSNETFLIVDILFRGAKESTGGIVRGAIPRSYFEDFYATINIRAGSDIGLVLPSGDVAVRSSFAMPGLTTVPMTLGNESAAASMVTIDGVQRFQAFKRLPDLPIMVFSALDARTVFAPWWSNVRFFAAVLVVLAAAFVVLGRLVVRSQRRQRWLATIVESSGEAIWSRGLDGRIISWNKGAEALFGYAPEEIIGRHIGLLWPPDQADELTRVMDGMNEAGSFYDDPDTTRRRKDGSLVAVAVNSSPIYDAGGTIIGATVSARDISDKKEAEDRLYHLAYFDPLVDLPNRSLLEERLIAAVGRSVADGSPLAFHYLDLDHFKDVNDSFGHRAGDRLLQDVAARVSEVVRRQDFVGRLGGDEFGIIQNKVADESDASQLAERILARLSAPFRIEGREVSAGVSIGTAVMSVSEAEELGQEEAARTLLQRADIAMYAAKTAGRQRHSIYADHHGDRVRRKMEVQESLARAVRMGALTLVYQPQIDLKSGRMLGAEALVRWTDPDRGAQAPSEFIEIAEQTGLIVPLGAWVLREACRTAAGWSDEDLVVAVNVSAVQLRRGGLFDLIRDALDETGLPPNRLELELTESALFRDTEDVTSLLWALRALGVRLAVDDFGTGYSTLSYFKDFPVDKLKIERTFVEGLAPNSRTLSIVRAAAAMADGLGLELVAEGIETEQQRDLLLKVGVTRGQGFLFARPMSGDSLSGFLRGTTGNVVRLDSATSD